MQIKDGRLGRQAIEFILNAKVHCKTLMNKARNTLAQEYVSQHLGIISKNSYIANSLYGRPDLPLERQNYK